MPYLVFSVDTLLSFNFFLPSILCFVSCTLGPSNQEYLLHLCDSSFSSFNFFLTDFRNRQKGVDAGGDAEDSERVVRFIPECAQTKVGPSGRERIRRLNWQNNRRKTEQNLTQGDSGTEERSYDRSKYSKGKTKVIGNDKDERRRELFDLEEEAV